MSHAAKTILFDNCIIEAPDGAVLGRCARKKLQWYLDRDMADLVCHDPSTIRLRFEPSGRKGANDSFNCSGKENVCVVCGRPDNLTRHHIIPHCIVKYMPVECKCHNSHDVVALCLDCHASYEIKSQQKKEEMAAKAGVSVVGGNAAALARFRKMRGFAATLVEDGDRMPPGRKCELVEILEGMCGRKLTQEDIAALATIDPKKEVGYVAFGEVIVRDITDFNEFAKEWRQHFLDVMQPKYMSDHWRADRRFEEDWVPHRFCKSKNRSLP